MTLLALCTLAAAALLALLALCTLALVALLALGGGRHHNTTSEANGKQCEQYPRNLSLEILDSTWKPPKVRSKRLQDAIAIRAASLTGYATSLAKPMTNVRYWDKVDIYAADERVRLGRADDEQDEKEGKNVLLGHAPSAHGRADRGQADSVQNAYSVGAAGARVRACIPGIQADDAPHTSGDQ